MSDKTEEEADYWDEYFTKNTIMPDFNKPCFFARKYGMTVKLDPETTRFLQRKPRQLINLLQKLLENWYGKKLPFLFN
ncbi:MAG: hypothetical protein FWB95_08490 [Treponema sp.]|nr:hypothetical protein [Treponema sp.]